MLDFLEARFSSIPLDNLNVILLLGIVLFCGTFGGRFFQKLKIPQVVGYITIGIILGQSGIRIISNQIIVELQPFNSFALALIGFMIGGELKIATFQKYGKQFLYILLSEALVAFLIVSMVLTGIGFYLFHDLNRALSLGLILGAIASATAPAATTDVLWENKTRGPLTTTLLGIVAMDDAVALLLYSMVTSIAGVLLGTSTSGFGRNVLHLFYEIGMAIGIGILAGVLLYRIIRGSLDEGKILAFSIGTILLIIGLTQTLGVDMIMAAMSMGFFISNFAPKRSQETFHLVDKFTPPIYVLFFVLVGAKLNIWKINYPVAMLALLFLFGRTFGKYLGARFGATVSNAPATVRKYLPFCLLSQAGVAIGLSIAAGETFQGTIGTTIIMVITTTTFVVQVTGPPFVKYAVQKAGEVGLNVTEDDLIRASRAGDIAVTSIPRISPEDSIRKILSLFGEHENLYYPVTDKDDKLLGVVTIENLKETFVTSELSDLLLAHDIMESIPCTCFPDTSVTEVRETMKTCHTEYIPMVGKDMTFIGMIESRSLQRLFSQRIAEYQKKVVALSQA